MAMNTPTNFSADHNGPSAAVFDHLLASRCGHRQRPDIWIRIVVKLLAFAAGCLIALAFSIYDSQPMASKVSASPVYAGGQTIPGPQA